METCECVLRSNGYADPECKFCHGQGCVDTSAFLGLFWAFMFTGAVAIAVYIIYEGVKK